MLVGDDVRLEYIYETSFPAKILDPVWQLRVMLFA